MTPDINRIYTQLDRIEDTLDRIAPELAAIKVDLNYHVHRTNLLEEKFDMIDKDVTKLRGFFTIGGWLIAAAATLLTIISKLGLL